MVSVELAQLSLARQNASQRILYSASRPRLDCKQRKHRHEG